MPRPKPSPEEKERQRVARNAYRREYRAGLPDEKRSAVANKAKSSMTKNEFIEFCRLVVARAEVA